MTRRKLIPSYLIHKQSGRGRAVWSDAAGIQRQRMFPGEFNSPESLDAFKRFQSELDISPVQKPDGATVNELFLAYVDHAATYYRRADGSPTNEITLVKLVSKPVRELYGDLSADEFGPLTLLVARERFIALGWSRRTVNQQVDRLRRIFRWGTERELVTGGVYQALAAVEPLKAGRCSAPESVPVKPADPAIVTATLRFLNRHIRTMVLLQQFTGMRPGEVCRMRVIEIDRTSEQWTYRPARHKSQYRGKSRTIMIGPRGRGEIEKFLAEGDTMDPSAPLFSPRHAREEVYVLLRAKRKTKVQPSQADRRKPNAKKLATQYSVNAYALAIRRAAVRAGVEHWHPNQLRHLFASEVRRGHGLEAAQVLLGHARADVTQVYAERNEELAATVAAKIG